MAAVARLRHEPQPRPDSPATDLGCGQRRSRRRNRIPHESPAYVVREALTAARESPSAPAVPCRTPQHIAVHGSASAVSDTAIDLVHTELRAGLGTLP